MNKNQNFMQFGFSEGLNPVMATLCITKTIAEARDNHTPLMVATLDIEKAFDVVDHDILRIKLNSAGIRGKLWLLIDDLHDRMAKFRIRCLVYVAHRPIFLCHDKVNMQCHFCSPA